MIDLKRATDLVINSLIIKALEFAPDRAALEKQGIDWLLSNWCWIYARWLVSEKPKG